MTLLHDRFEVLDELGRGAQAVTFRARDHHSGDIVALKELDFRRVSDWKAHELFEREAATLRSLDHPAIPRYVDAFVVEEEDAIRLFLAQEFVDGKTLAEELTDGRRWDATSARDDALELLRALHYLHGLTPPVVHRDIKPSNIIRRPDGRLALIDFGAVQNALPTTVGGSTVIGTPGYMPMEQVLGRAVPATDLYALGATLVHLLTRTEPSALPAPRNRLQFRDRISVDDELACVLEKMLEPSAEDRLRSATKAAELLEQSPDIESPDGTKGEDPRDRKKTDVATKNRPHQPPQETSIVTWDGTYPGWVLVGENASGAEQISLRLADESGRGARVRVVTDDRRIQLRTNWTDSGHSEVTPGATLVLISGLGVVFFGALVTGLHGWALVGGIGLFFVTWLLISNVLQNAPELRFEVEDGRLLQEETPGKASRVKEVRVEGAWIVADTADGHTHRLISAHPDEGNRQRWLAGFLRERVKAQQAPGLIEHEERRESGEGREFWKEVPEVDH